MSIRLGEKTNEVSIVTNHEGSDLKKNAVEYFRAKSSIYNERYSVRATGDLLRVRHNAILEIVRGWAQPAGSRLLDLGCGPGPLTRDLAKMGYLGVGLDASTAMIEFSTEQAKKEGISDLWTYKLGDVEAVPFPDDSFDAAVCSGVIDYLPSDERVIAEAARVLKPGGRFVLCFTNKFGYTVSLSTPIYWLKRIPAVRVFASKLRSMLVGGKQGAMEFDFLPRKQSPTLARKAVKNSGFDVESDMYVHFSLLPAPFCTMTSRLNLGIDEKFNALDRTPLRAIGSCYILNSIIRK
jgi:ubiquinone/menaquinone biosynthesis C-methylase UbiE